MAKVMKGTHALDQVQGLKTLAVIDVCRQSLTFQPFSPLNAGMWCSLLALFLGCWCS